MYQTIKHTIEDNILIISLNRPDKMNTLNELMVDELLDVLDYADDNDEVRSVIVTGEGKAFCAGLDLGDGEDAFESATSKVDDKDIGGKVSLRVYRLKKPIIAAINGAAVGVGITMTLPMDIRICSEKTKIGFVFSKRGIIAESCSSWFLPRIVGISKASEWMFTGEVFSAMNAHEAKLVNEVVPPGDVLEKAKEYAKRMMDQTSSVSIAISRQLLWQMLGPATPEDAHEMESKLMKWIGYQENSKEGVRSFLERREAEFPMKVSKDMPSFFP